MIVIIISCIITGILCLWLGDACGEEGTLADAVDHGHLVYQGKVYSVKYEKELEL